SFIVITSTSILLQTAPINSLTDARAQLQFAYTSTFPHDLTPKSLQELELNTIWDDYVLSLGTFVDAFVKKPCTGVLGNKTKISDDNKKVLKEATEYLREIFKEYKQLRTYAF